MGVGLGIHGEPGIAEDAAAAAPPTWRTSSWTGCWPRRRRTTTNRVGAILNGLGATKYEELFVVWRTVARLLRDAGYTVVDPEVGELVTSLDMAGCSLTLVYLDDELERFWRAPADTPAYRKGAAAGTQAAGPGGRSARAARAGRQRSGRASRRLPRARPRRRRGAARRWRPRSGRPSDELARIDAVAGDGDHGRGMVKGITAALEAAAGAARGRAPASPVLGRGR